MNLPCSGCSGNSTSGSGQMLVAATLIFFFSPRVSGFVCDKYPSDCVKAGQKMGRL